MATKDEMGRLVGKAMVDQAFRAEFLKDPTTAAAGEGVTLTEEQAKTLKGVDLSEITSAIEKVESKGCGVCCG